MNETFKHLLDLASLTKPQIHTIFQHAQHFYQASPETIKPILANKTVMNLFFENSTRTRCSFEVGAKRLGANVINLDIKSSSANKGENLLDTVENLNAMKTDLFIIRHTSSGAAMFLADHLKSQASIINAGDGCHEHPSQGLLDLFAIYTHKKTLESLKVAIVGDILHSRVARSLMYGLKHLSVGQINLVGPKTLIPQGAQHLGVNIFHECSDGIRDADVIVALRLQKERMNNVYLPSESEYLHLYGIDEEKLKLANPDVLVMHPGPINRGVEISSAVADGPHSIILKQVELGVAVRMAVMALLLNPEAL